MRFNTHGFDAAILDNVPCELAGMISGGYYRDIALDRKPKDIDLFVLVPEGMTVQYAQVLLEDAYGYIDWLGSGMAYSFTDNRVVASGTFKWPMAEESPINVILTRWDLETLARHNDYGINQVWKLQGEPVTWTTHFVDGITQKVFKLVTCADQRAFDRSMRRWDRFQPRYPGFTLEVPQEFAHYKPLDLELEEVFSC